MNTTNQTCSILHTFKTYTVGDPQTFWMMVQAVGVIITLWLIWRQIKLQGVGNSISSLTELESEWKSDKMAEARREICKCYKDGKDGGIQSAERIACFFETLGLYHERKMFDTVLIWELYSSYVENYWPILKPRIEKMRADDGDHSIYTHFEDFYDRMRVESKNHGAPTDVKTPEVLLAFSKWELERK
jgi:hypothetical protein